MHLSMHNWMRAEPIEVTIARLAKYGYESIEIGGEPKRYNTKDVKRTLDECGVRCWGAVTLMFAGLHWPITEQTKLFSIFGDTERLVGVRLTDSMLMLPRKSISGILFPSEEGFVACQLCEREHCPGRKAAYTGRM